MVAGKQNSRNYNANHFALQRSFTQMLRANPGQNFSYVDTSISCSYSRISLPVDGAQNHHGLWRIPAKDKPLRQTKIDQKISWPCSCLLLQGYLASERQTGSSKVQPKHTVLSEDWQSKCRVLTLKRLVEGTSKRWRTKLQFIIVWHKEHSTTRSAAA